jgi:hypothetical protein
MPERHKAESGSRFLAGYDAVMETIVINIDWAYFLGLIGSLIAIVYYAQGRFTTLETDVAWLKDTISELTIQAENIRAKLFKSSSPVSLTQSGYVALKRSGLRSYIDANRNVLLGRLKRKSSADPYELQQHIFRLFAELPLEEPVAHHLSKFAFANDISPDLLRRVGAIYLRDIAAPGR